VPRRYTKVVVMVPQGVPSGCVMMADMQGAPKNIGVLIIDFSPVVCEGLWAIMAKDSEIEFLGDASDGAEALLHIKGACGQGRPASVVLTETCNGKVDGVQAIRLIKDEFPEVAVLVLTENIKDSYDQKSAIILKFVTVPNRN
jgi:chemotaxis response regulator CheB